MPALLAAESAAPVAVETPLGTPDKQTKIQIRQPGLDLLRAIAIGSVVIFHSGGFGFKLPHDWHRFGWAGVDLFFVLSGYLIGGQLWAELQARKSIRFGRFYARRALRILPAYLVILTIYFCFPMWREQAVISPLWKYVVSIQNLDLHAGTAFSHAWSLAVEDQFYLVLPGLLFLLFRSPRLALVVPWFILAGGLVLRASLVKWKTDAAGHLSDHDFMTWIYYPTWTRLDSLVLGVVLAAIERHRSAWWRTLMGGANWLWLPALAAVAGGLYLSEAKLTLVSCVWSFPLIAFGMTLFLVCSVSPRLPFQRMQVPGVAFLSMISYSVYLSHKLVVHLVAGLCSQYSIPPTSFGALLTLYVLVCVCGAALFFAVERPFLQLRNRIAA